MSSFGERWVAIHTQRRMVVQINENSQHFMASLLDEQVKNQTEIPIADISPKDRAKFQVGAKFLHTWGIRDSASGNRQRVSFLEFE